MKARHEFGTPEQWYDYLRTYFASQAIIGLACISPDVATERAVELSEKLLKTLQK